MIFFLIDNYILLIIKNMKLGTKGSKYIGVYKCNKTNKFYSKNTKNKKCYKSKLFKDELDAANKYDTFILNNFKNIKNIKKKLNFPNNIKKKPNMVKKNTTKRPKIYEYIKNIIYAKQNDKCSLCKNSLGVGRIIDHIIPRCLGGIDNINNYQAICGTCNKWKTYSFDHNIKKYIEKYKKINLDDILKFQKKEFNKFNGEYPNK